MEREGVLMSEFFKKLFSLVTVFFGAFLLFQIQPLVTKVILPWFGGSPFVWSTAMLFFQIALLLGYAYAYALLKLPSRKLQLGIHLSLIVCAVLLQPVLPLENWKPQPEDDPVRSILLILLMHVGLPFLLLASTGPLVQYWYSHSKGTHDTYRLYAFSNLASLSALLTFPLFFEYYFKLETQGWIWSSAFLLYAGFFAILAVKLKDVLRDGDSETVGGGVPSWQQRIQWLLYPFFAVWMLLAATNHVCQDVAVVPFLWILPLSLYLLTFIICFDKARWYKPVFYGICSCLLLPVLSCIIFFAPILFRRYFMLEAGLYFSILFCSCMLCHGELVRQKPNPRYLTSFYLMIALGGALGGVYVNLLSPILYTSYFEVPQILLIMLFVSLYVLMKNYFVNKFVNICLLTAFVLSLLNLTSIRDKHVLEEVRNFYGVLRVKMFNKHIPDLNIVELYHGRIIHGTQAVLQPFLATDYFSENSGAGLTLTHYPRSPAHKVGVVGLGAGVLAVYGKEGDQYHFYEINPLVVKLSQDHFSFLKDSKAEIDFHLGDARLSLERQVPQDFDVLILDAFTGDSPPVHLLTLEAVELYMKHLKPSGVLLVNVLNSHVNLPELVMSQARHSGLQYAEVSAKNLIGFAGLESHWVLISRDNVFFENEHMSSEFDSVNRDVPKLKPWTDQYSNLFSIIKFK
jgi:hypothetical protein